MDFEEIIQQEEISEKPSENCSLHTAKAIEIYKAISYIINANHQKSKQKLYYFNIIHRRHAISSLINFNNDNIVLLVI